VATFVSVTGEALLSSAGKLNIFPWESTDINQLIHVSQSGGAYGWSEKQFKDCINASCYGWVVRNDEDDFVAHSLDAFIIYSIVAQECQLLNVCVKSSCKRHGYAVALIEKMIVQARMRSCQVVLLEVRASNVAAQSLYEKLSFECIGCRSNYYHTKNAHEDALLYRLSLK
jgi:[ribosomal protein S18]-alanine N-acetyltransferase